MLDAVIAVVAVLVGAVATFAIQEWRAERERRDILLKRGYRARFERWDRRSTASQQP